MTQTAVTAGCPRCGAPLRGFVVVESTEIDDAIPGRTFVRVKLRDVSVRHECEEADE